MAPQKKRTPKSRKPRTKPSPALLQARQVIKDLLREKNGFLAEVEDLEVQLAEAQQESRSKEEELEASRGRTKELEESLARFEKDFAREAGIISSQAVDLQEKDRDIVFLVNVARQASDQIKRQADMLDERDL